MPGGRRGSRRCVVSLTLLFFSLSCVAIAQEMEEGWIVDSYFRHMPSSKIKEGSGRIEVMEVSSGVAYSFKAFAQFPVEVSLENNYISLEDSIHMELPAHLVSLKAGIETTLPFLGLDSTYLRFGVIPGVYGDDWNFDTSDFRISAQTYAIYIPDEQWTFILGVGISSDSDPECYPIGGLIYTPNDRLIVRLVPDRPGISYRLNDKLTVFTEGGWSRTEYDVKEATHKKAALNY
ncbi:MAG: hypothetical protein KKC84_05605, partial [Candidatus Omnitrophica bacterium]|nr:hypothetical protein [Candidatus Omnitrophota bacterium]